MSGSRFTDAKTFVENTGTHLMNVVGLYNVIFYKTKSHSVSQARPVARGSTSLPSRIDPVSRKRAATLQPRSLRSFCLCNLLFLSHFERLAVILSAYSYVLLFYGVTTQSFYQRRVWQMGTRAYWS